jgi:phage tail sheath gpL-like
MKTTKTKGAAHRAAKTTTTTDNANDVRALAEAMAAQIDSDCHIPVTVTIRLYPNELILISRRARYTGETVDQIIEKYVGDCHGGLSEDLNDWGNELPEFAKVAAAAA